MRALPCTRTISIAGVAAHEAHHVMRQLPPETCDPTTVHKVPVQRHLRKKGGGKKARHGPKHGA